MGGKNIDVKQYEDLLSKYHKLYDDLSSPGGSNKDDPAKLPVAKEAEAFALWDKFEKNPFDPFVINLGDIQIKDTNKDGNYDKGKDKIVKRGADGKEIELSLNSKEVKEFKEKYKIDLNSNRQFWFHGAVLGNHNGVKRYDWGGAEAYVRNLDNARGKADKGDVEGAKFSLDNAHTNAGEANLKWDGNLEQGIIKTADQNGVVVAYHQAEAAAANGYVDEANKWLGLAEKYATDAAGIDNKKNVDPKLYDAAYAKDIGKEAYKNAIEKRLALAEKMGAVGNKEGYNRMMGAVHQYAKEAKEKYGAEIKIDAPFLNPDSTNYKIASSYYSSIQTQESIGLEFQGMLLQAERSAQLGDVGAVDKKLAEAEKYWMENRPQMPRELRFNEEQALATKNFANEKKLANEKKVKESEEFYKALENFEIPSIF